MPAPARAGARAPAPIVDSIASAAVAAHRAHAAHRAALGSHGARAARPAALRKHAARVRRLRAERVSASAGLAAFYAGLDRAIAQMNQSSARQVGRASLWPLQTQERGVLSRNRAIALGAGLLAVGLLLGFALVPRLAAAGFLPLSRSSPQLMHEALALTLGAVAVCIFLAVLLLRAAL
jgi:hypothetical protein